MAQKVVDGRLTYFGVARLSLLMDMVEQVNAQGVRGDLAEFGIALGGSAICIASKLAGGQKFYGFDNFEMIPSPEPIDGDVPNARYDVIKSGQSTGIGSDLYYGYEKNRLALVTRNFEAFGLPVDGRRIRLIKGLFDDTLPSGLPGPIAFAHVDWDWYSPVKLCLEVLHPHLDKGATVFVDDYGHWAGATKAIDEFCAQHADIGLTAGPGHAILVKR